jgi:phage-related tail fiber protein
MSETFTNVLTIKGQQKKASAEAGGAPVNITHFKIGDSNGGYYNPLSTQTDLVHTVYSGEFIEGSASQIIVNPSAENEVLYKCFIPANVGGFTVRELGLFEGNDLCHGAVLLDALLRPF